MVEQCSICENSSKYKCSKCRIPYCSVSCCKAHKEVCSVKASGEGSAEPTTAIADDHHGEHGEWDLLSTEQIEALDHSAKIQSMLKSERLKSHILQVDGASKRQGALKRLREKVPEFDGFIETVLDVAGKVSKTNPCDSAITKAKQERESLQQLVLEAEQNSRADIDASGSEGEESDCSSRSSRSSSSRSSISGGIV